MSGCVMIDLAKGETARLKKFLSEKLEFEDGCFISSGPEVKGFCQGSCWIDFKFSRMEIGYGLGGTDRDWASAIRHEVCKKVKVIRGGWESEGVTDDLEEFKSGKPYSYDILMASGKSFLSKIINKPKVKSLKKLQSTYLEAASDLFKELGDTVE